jgi:hypothetical protein
VPQNTHPRGSAITSLNLDVRSAGISGMTSFGKPSCQIVTVPRSINRSKDPSNLDREATHRSALVTLLVLFALRVITKQSAPWNIGPVQLLVRVHAKADFRQSRTHGRPLSRTARIQRRYLELRSHYSSYSGRRSSTGASLILFLAADDSGAVANQSYIIDGGCVGIRLPDYWQNFWQNRFLKGDSEENKKVRITANLLAIGLVGLGGLEPPTPRWCFRDTSSRADARRSQRGKSDVSAQLLKFECHVTETVDAGVRTP